MSGPGADELRVRQLLIKQGVGPDATPADTPPKRPARPRDWLDDILDQPAPKAEPEPEKADEPEAQPEQKPAVQQAAKPKKPKASTRKKRRKPASRRPNPAAPRSAWDTQPASPRQSLLDAWDRTPYRLKWLGFHTIAAAAGWRIGLVTWSTNTAAWYAAGHWTSSSAWVLYGLGALAVALYRRARGWAWPVRLVASIPVCSVVVGVLLYAPTR